MTLKTIYQDRYVSLIHAIKQIRKDNQLTQTDVAHQLGKLQSYVAKVENFERHLDVLEFVDLCRVVGADPAMLINQYLWHSTQLRVLALLLKAKHFFEQKLTYDCFK